MSAKNEQVGGDHYKSMAIQPMEFIHRNGIGFLAGSAIKYLCRYKLKGGREDLEKAIHFIRLLIDEEYPEEANQPSRPVVIEAGYRYLAEGETAMMGDELYMGVLGWCALTGSSLGKTFPKTTLIRRKITQTPA